ncbi:hypothetical protein N431DRAFT_412750 [Stipitochalara longipes BDJ]|nr:hypothetical protein N431DRAFT_412750 [Stipitochalara longipes BDJ]
MNADFSLYPDRKRKAEDVPPPFSISTFSLREGQQITPSQKRTRFNQERRLQIQRVRKRGACLRCRLMKISCSDDDLCTTCLRAARLSYKHEKQVFGFIGCVRTSLLDVSIFPHAIHKAFLPGDFLRVLTASWVSLLQGKDSSRGQIDAPNDIPSVFYTFVYQLNNSKLISVETLGKPRETLSNSTHFIEDTVPEIVQCYASLIPISRRRIRVQQQTSPNPAIYSTAILGEKCLFILEQQLKPTILSNYSSRRLRALFLLIFGVILLAATADPACELPTFPEEDPARSATPRTLFDVLQLHLCNMLVHYLTFLGSKLGLFDSVDSAKSLKVKDFNESILQWERILLSWILHWQSRDFDREWLKEWASVQSQGV